MPRSLRELLRSDGGITIEAARTLDIASIFLCSREVLRGRIEAANRGPGRGSPLDQVQSTLSEGSAPPGCAREGLGNEAAALGPREGSVGRRPIRPRSPSMAAIPPLPLGGSARDLGGARQIPAGLDASGASAEGSAPRRSPARTTARASRLWSGSFDELLASR